MTGFTKKKHNQFHKPPIWKSICPMLVSSWLGLELIFPSQSKLVKNNPRLFVRSWLVQQKIMAKSLFAWGLTEEKAVKKTPSPSACPLLGNVIIKAEPEQQAQELNSVPPHEGLLVSMIFWTFWKKRRPPFKTPPSIRNFSTISIESPLPFRKGWKGVKSA